MKFPSIFKTARPMRFEMKPRHYDPVKEEIEQKTARIKRELEAKGLLKPGEGIGEKLKEEDYHASTIRGAFTHGGPIRNKPSSIFNSVGMLRLIILLFLVGTITGYLYWGADILYYMLYLAIGIAAVVLFFRLKGKKHE
ncbi:hypothetical protein QWY93_05400 [Echinicola jeungdonensis]|uniref:Uncharacterized protein n=1 Tax=Echinicola jeungdonensis TaxID=709343 RepID=A0ABV5J4J3_9BACT|nr:hypothetical protein [Echinicola jeungdonensis]MDN3668759.1 hypothetical protein [Echinicola jeungdonensis]